MDPLTSLLLPALCGVGIGVLSGLLGIGGGTVMVPAFRLLFGMSPTMSTATSLFAIIPTSISGVSQHLRNKTCIPAVGVAAGLGGALTSPVGVWLANVSPGWLVMAAAALIIGWSAVSMLGKALRKSGGAGASSGPGTSAEGPAAESAPSRRALAKAACIGLGAGLASGYVGVGGGFLMVPLFISVLGVSMKKASGTSLIAVMILAVPGVVEQMILGNVNYAAGLAVVCGTIPGAVVGARLVRVVPERALRLIFGAFLLVAAALLVLNEFGLGA